MIELARRSASLARLMKVIPIDRASLRRLPDVVGTVASPAERGPDRGGVPRGHHVVRPGLRAVPARDVPGRRRRGQAGSAAAADATTTATAAPSTVAAYVGDDTLLASIRRLVTARRTIVHVQVESLQLPGDGPARPGRPLRGGGPR